MKEIIESIKKGYTGDYETDTQYLLSQMDKYKDNQPVIKEIYKLLYELLPQNIKDNFVRSINQKKFEERLREIQELVSNKQFKRALDYLDMAIEKIEKVYEDDKNVYMTFHNPFEAYYYSVIREDKTKTIKNAELDFGTFYKFRGIILDNLKRYEEAEADLLESFKWNPLDFEAIFEYAECLYNQKKYEEFLKYNLDTLKHAFTNYAIAMCYHNIGLYYMAKGTKKDDFIAYDVISYSISFEETDYAYRDLNTICEKYKMKKELAKQEDIFACLKKNKLPLSPNEELVMRLIGIAQRFMNVNDEFALQVYRLIYQLTHDDITLEYIKAGEKIVASKKKD